jgi:hypothetical protein
MWKRFILLLLLTGCESKKEREYLDSLGLEFRGVIQFMETPDNFNGFSVMNVSVIHSNIVKYDKREMLDCYYCVILGGSAQFYPGDIRECDIGDTIEVNTSKRLFLVHKINGEILKKEMIFYTNEQFYRYVQKHYKNF